MKSVIQRGKAPKDLKMLTYKLDHTCQGMICLVERHCKIPRVTRVSCLE